MAPTRHSSSGKPSKPSNKARKLSSTSLSASAKAKPNRVSKSKSTRPPTKQQKTRPNLHNPSATSQNSNSKTKLKKKPTYTDKQLKLPALNAITPANAAPNAPAGILNKRGKKRKVYVDDEEGMKVLMGLAMAEREGQVEGRIQRLRAVEAVRESRLKEAEKKAEREKKEGLKGKGAESNAVSEKRRRDKEKALENRRRGGIGEGEAMGKENGVKDGSGNERKRKKVSFV